MNAKQHMVVGLRSGGVLQGERREKQPNGMRVPAPRLRVRPPEPGSPEFPAAHSRGGWGRLLMESSVCYTGPALPASGLHEA